MSEGRDPERPRVLIVGGGLAGAALAFRLTQAGMPDVTLLEREAVPGVHASGQNAAMVRRICAEPAIAALARAGADFIAEPDAFTEPLAFRQTGSLL
ncbi:MAG: FAD-dependent oxidoreductase, partial [Planctomycetota bacterium]